MRGQLTKKQIKNFRLLARGMSPASTEYGLPGGDDQKIFDNILVAAQVDLQLLEKGLSKLDDLSRAHHKKEFLSLDDQMRSNIISSFLASSAIYVDVISNLILQCYYRDDRVMNSLGMELQSPFPSGYEVDQSDWSLLEPVRKKDKIYRDS